MSFSSEVKEELAKHISSARHCQLEELAAIMNFCGQYGRDEEGNYTIGFQTENETVVKKAVEKKRSSSSAGSSWYRAS